MVGLLLFNMSTLKETGNSVTMHLLISRMLSMVSALFPVQWAYFLMMRNSELLDHFVGLLL
jgi:hypothetical protein